MAGIGMATLCLAALSQPALANPTGASVASGQATITAPSATELNIDQKTKIIIIDWKSFNIAAGETTKFSQPGSNALAVNRIGDADPATILGNLVANGRVILIDGNGILFGPNAQVNVGALLATTSDAKNEDILSGKTTFDKAGNPNAQIVNNCTITATSGMVGLVAPAVANNGIIRAKLGQVALGASNVFTVDFTGDGLISFPVDPNIVAGAIDANGKPVKALVANNGRIEGATVLLSARAAADLVTNVISIKGEVVAKSIGEKGGHIVLDAGEGSIALTGAKLDASGANGGGSITLGSVKTASVTADKATVLDASATQSGNGGSIYVNSASTAFHGTAKAKGGAKSGDGGKIETSGHELNVDGALVDTSAAHGVTGDWLLDPYDVTISTDSTSNNALSTGTYTPSGNDSVINVTDLQNALASSDVTITTGSSSSQAGDITVAAALTWSSSSKLMLDAYHSIDINAPITVSGAGQVVLTTNDGGSGGDYTFLGGSSLQFTGTEGSGQALTINGSSYTLLYTMAEVQAISSNLTANYAVAKPLDATTDSTTPATWLPIGVDGSGNPLNGANGFTGIFEGLGNTISNLTIVHILSTKSPTGVFSIGSGTIRDFGVVGGSVTGSNDSTGALIGENYGTLLNVNSTAAVYGDYYTGGLVGLNTGTITNAYASGSVSARPDSPSTIFYDGGFVGSNGGTITNAYATGVVNFPVSRYSGGFAGNNAGTISNAYATGAVSPNSRLPALNTTGGFNGGDHNHAQTNTYWDQNLSGQATSDGGTSQTTAQLQAGPTGLNASPWVLKPGFDPYLAFQAGPNSPNVPTISGTVYSDYDVTALGGAHVVEAFVTGGTVIATGTSATNGVLTGGYSVNAPLTDGTLLLFLDNSNGKFATTVVNYTGSTMTGVNLYAGYLNFVNTSQVSVAAMLSSLSSFAAPTGGYSTSDFLFGVSGSLVSPTASLAIGSTGAVTIDTPLNFTGTGGLAIDADSIAVNDNVGIAGTGAVSLRPGNNTTTGVLKLTFELGKSIDFGGTNNGASLSIGGTAYTLLYSMRDLQNIGSNLSGYYALATSLSALNTASWTPIGTSAQHFSGKFDGLGNSISNINWTFAGSVVNAGLFGYSSGVLRNLILSGGSITAAGGASNNSGALVGDNAGYVYNIFSSANVSAGDGEVGGLVGLSGAAGQIINVFGSGLVSGTGDVGGLVGKNLGQITNVYSTGAASNGSAVGGLVGIQDGVVENSFSSAYVSGSQDVGGLAGQATGGFINNVYWDSKTSGASQDIGSTSGNGGSKTTSALRTAVPSAWSTGGFSLAWSAGSWAIAANASYPYLTSFFPNGVAVISGTAYSDSGVTALRGGAVTALITGKNVVASSTGANGIYYLLFPSEAISGSGSAALAYVSSGGTGARAYTLTGTTSGFDIWGSTLIAPTAATTYSATVATSLQTEDAALIASADGGYGAATTAVAALSKYGYIVSGSGFTVDRALTLTEGDGLYIKTLAGDITVSNAVSLANGSLVLDSFANLNIAANLSVSGKGAVMLTTSDGGSGDYTFLGGTNLQFTGTEGAGQGLTINGTSYSLLYTVPEVQAINTGLSGNYALAKSLDATNTSGWTPIGTDASRFSGTFEGLGNIISNLTISPVSTAYVGLFGAVDGSGVVRDLGMAGGTVSGGSSATGAMVGVNYGRVQNDYAGATVNGSTDVGGLVGINNGLLLAIFATGNVTGTGDNVGGLVGENTSYASSVNDSYATGNVSGANNVGGLIGYNDSLSSIFPSRIVNSYAVGTVTGTSNVGGVVGNNTGSLSNVYWDSSVTATGIGSNTGTGAPTSETTSNLQAGPTGFDASPWLTRSGFYPYLNFQTPPSYTVSGTVYSDYGVTALGNAHVIEAFLTGGAVIATGMSNGTTGAYSVNAPSSSGTLLLFLNGGGKFADTVVDYSGSSLTGVNLYAGYLNFINTSAVSVSSVLSSLSSFIAPTGGYSANDFLFTVSGSTVTPTAGLAVISTAATFTVDRTFNLTGTNGLAVKALAGDIVISNPVSLVGGNFTFNATGDIAVNAPITVSGGGSLSLRTGHHHDYSLANGISITFTGGSSSGASLNIDGDPYTLLYSMSSLQALNVSNTALQGNYGLAISLNAASTTNWTPIGVDGTGTPLFCGCGFQGIFAGLGHTISNLTVNLPTLPNVGLFGDSEGFIRDIGLVGGSFTGKKYVGALAGYSDGEILNAYATSTVTAGSGGYAGGLVGYGDLDSYIANSSATGAVTDASDNTGGLAGYNDGVIFQSFATGKVQGKQFAGGLVGWNNEGLVLQSYATGAVSGTNVVGGLVGDNQDGAIEDSYSLGPANGADDVGGLVGYNRNSSEIAKAYSIGAVTGTGHVGGLVGHNDSTSTITVAYWDSQTSGVANGIGADNNNQAANVTGLATAALLNTLGGYSTADWATGPGLLPYLQWQFPTGTPQAISGFAYSDRGLTPLASGASGAIGVSVLVAGASLGTGYTGANGYYYVLAAPGTLTGTQPILAYLSGDVANANTFIQSANGNATADLFGNTLRLVGAAASLSSFGTTLSSALGSNSGSDFLFTLSGNTISLKSAANLEISDDWYAFVIDQAISTTGTVILNMGGTTTQSAPITAGSLALDGAHAGYILTNAANSVGTLADFNNNHSLNFVDSTALTIGTVGADFGIAGFTSVNITAGGNLTVAASVSSRGTTTLKAHGNLTINSGKTVTGVGDVVLSATGNFVNNAGSSAVSSSGGRWLVYSASPASDTFGSLDSANTAIWDATYATLAPGSVTASGNRYIFANQPTLTITTTDASKTYGTDGTSAIASSYTITGIDPGISGVYLADTASSVYSGAPTLASDGTATTASVAGGPYTITATQGSLTLLNGYALAFANTGMLAVDPAAISATITYSVADATSTYGTLATLGAITLTGVLPDIPLTCQACFRFMIAATTLPRCPPR